MKWIKQFHVWLGMWLGKLSKVTWNRSIKYRWWKPRKASNNCTDTVMCTLQRNCSSWIDVKFSEKKYSIGKLSNLHTNTMDVRCIMGKHAAVIQFKMRFSQSKSNWSVCFMWKSCILSFRLASTWQQTVKELNRCERVVHAKAIHIEIANQAYNYFIIYLAIMSHVQNPSCTKSLYIWNV